MIESSFGASTPFSIGLEEELMILDAETFEPAPAVDVLLRGSEGVALPGRLKTELFASVVELNTSVCADVGEAVAALEELRAAAGRIAAANGLTVAAAGMHPTAELESLVVVDEERYRSMVREVGRAARRQGVYGLHVHVGVESADACHAALEAVLPWLPVVLAISVNSPLLAGEATGMLSNRASILGELPRAGSPPPFRSYADWEAWVERSQRLRVIDDYTQIWWDVRPHPRFGTLEVRMPDQPTAPARTALLAGLVRQLVEHAPRREPDPAGRAAYSQNRWAAASLGLDAALIHPDGDRVVPGRELAAALLGGPVPASEAQRQLEVGAPAAAADLVARTLG